MSIVITPQPDHVPPRVRIDVGADDPASTLSSLTISRDGKPIREQPYLGGPEAVAFDYEAPFGVPVSYSAAGAVLPPVEADWSESWASLSAWSGSGFTVSGGKARSTVLDAAIVRSATGAIQRLEVADPSYVRVELLDAGNVVVGSVQVGTSVVVVGTSSVTAVGAGSFVASLVNGTMSVTGIGWAATVPYTGTPTQVRVVSLGINYATGLSFPTAVGPRGVAVDGAGNIYVVAGDMVRKYDSSGAQVLSFASAAARAIHADSAGDIFTAGDDRRFRKYDAAGVQQFASATLGVPPRGIATDSMGRIYVSEGGVIRRYSSSGGSPMYFANAPAYGITFDAAGNLFAADRAGNHVLKIDTSGTVTQVISVNRPLDVAVDASGNIFAACEDGGVRKFNSAGVQVMQIVTNSSSVALDAAGNVYSTDQPARTLRKFAPVTPSVGAIVETPTVAPESFSESGSTQLEVTDVWLIHPSLPSLSISIDSGPQGAHHLRFIEASSGEAKSSEAQRTIHRGVGSRRAVVITSGPRAADEWTLVVGAPTIEQKDAVRAIVDDQTPLLLRIPPSMQYDLPDDWYSVGDLTVARTEVPVITKETLITLPLTPVDEPIVRQGALWTYGSDLLLNATYAASRARFPTYLDRLAGAS